MQSLGIKKVHYTTETGDITSEKIRTMISTHNSQLKKYRLAGLVNPDR
jgi:hypothetical protein